MILIKQTLFLLGSKRRYILWMIGLFFVASLTELVGLGLIVPYMLLILNPESVVDSVIGQLVTKYFPSFVMNELIVLASCILVGVFFLKALLALVIARIIIVFGLNTQTHLRCSLMSLYQNLTYAEYQKRNSAEYISP